MSNEHAPIIPTTEIVENQFVFYEASFWKLAPEVSRARFRVWLEEIVAAAEQRGAVKALLEAAESKSLIDYMYTNLHVNQPVAVREAAKYLHNRADRMEGDDD